MPGDEMSVAKVLHVLVPVHLVVAASNGRTQGHTNGGHERQQGQNAQHSKTNEPKESKREQVRVTHLNSFRCPRRNEPVVVPRALSNAGAEQLVVAP